jgi:hypothetical protein
MTTETYSFRSVIITEIEEDAQGEDAQGEDAQGEDAQDEDAQGEDAQGEEDIQQALQSILSFDTGSPRNISITTKQGFNCSECISSIAFENCVTIQCNHSFCKDCIKVIISKAHQEKKDPTCPFCRAVIETLSVNKKSIVDELVA